MRNSFKILAIAGAIACVSSTAMSRGGYYIKEYIEVPYTEIECTYVDHNRSNRSGDMIVNGALGAIIGGVIGNQIGNYRGNGAIGAVTGGMIGIIATDSNHHHDRHGRQVCREVTRYRTEIVEHWVEAPPHRHHYRHRH